ncbi:MAG: hypothetical protein ACXWJW_11695 [Xanthobacteraceae bacterium]
MGFPARRLVAEREQPAGAAAVVRAVPPAGAPPEVSAVPQRSAAAVGQAAWLPAAEVAF